MRVLRFAVRRLLFLPVALLLVVTVSFFVVNLVPANPGGIILGVSATPSAVAHINARLGVTGSLWGRYWTFIVHLLHGHLGASFFDHTSVLLDIGHYLPSTIELITLALCVAALIGTAVGLAGSITASRATSRAARILVSLVQGTPDFVVGLVLIYFLFYLGHVVPAPTGQLGLLDVSPPRITGSVIVDSALADQWKTFGSALYHAVLPVLSLGIFYSAFFAKTVRSVMSRGSESRQVEFARACGLPRWKVVGYGLRGARTAVITYWGILFSALVGGAALVETVFSWNGIGQWIVGRVLQQDVPPVEGFILVSGLITLVVFLAVDILVVLFDPRLSLGSGSAKPGRGGPASSAILSTSPVAATDAEIAEQVRSVAAVGTPAPGAAGGRGGDQAVLEGAWARVQSTLLDLDRESDEVVGSGPERSPAAGRVRSVLTKPAELVGAIPRKVKIGGIILAVLLVGGFAAPLHNAAMGIHPRDLLFPPSLSHWFGTDDLGRDVFARVLLAARLDLPLALEATALSLVVGVVIGLAVSWRARAAEWFMRALDMFQAFPLLILAIVLVTFAGNHLIDVVFAIAVINVPQFIRLVRAEALTVRSLRYVEAAVSIGASRLRVIVRHILPNIVSTVLVQGSLCASQAIITIAAMSFLGIGVTPPTASWGAMVQEGAQYVSIGNWWPMVFPALGIFVCVYAFNMIAEGLEQRFDRGAGG